jgi:carbon monoxide dehydrogenase subunit G
MNVIQSLPRWASAPLQKLADKEPIPGTQSMPLDQDTFNQTSETAIQMLTMTLSDEVKGEDLAMGQPGVFSPQEGVTLRFSGDVSSANGTVEVVLDQTDQGGAIYVRRGPNSLDTIAVMQQEGAVVAQAAYVEQSPFGMSGEVVAGQVG